MRTIERQSVVVNKAGNGKILAFLSQQNQFLLPIILCRKLSQPEQYVFGARKEKKTLDNTLPDAVETLVRTRPFQYYTHKLHNIFGAPPSRAPVQSNFFKSARHVHCDLAT